MSEEYAAGLRGDWRVAAAAWQRVGDPYERALELAESHVDHHVSAVLQKLGVSSRKEAAAAAADLVE